MQFSRLICLSIFLMQSAVCMETADIDHNAMHRGIVEGIIAKHGINIIGRAIQKQIQANGWNQVSPRLGGITADQAKKLFQPKLNDPMLPMEIIFYRDPKPINDHKIAALITAAIGLAGIAIISWASYELVSAYKKVSQDEWDKSHSYSDKAALIVRKTRFFK